MRTPTGPPPTTTTFSPAASAARATSCTAPRRPARRAPRRAGTARPATAPGGPAARSRAAASTPGSRYRRSPGDRRCGHGRPGTSAHWPHQRSGITVTGSPAAQSADTRCPGHATRPDISCPMTPGPRPGRPCAPCQDVQVGAADADVGDRELHLPGPGRAGVRLRDLDPRPATYWAASIRRPSRPDRPGTGDRGRTAGASARWCRASSGRGSGHRQRPRGRRSARAGGRRTR